MPKTLLGDQCPAVWNTRISYQLTWLSGLNIFLSITAVLGNALILVAPSKMLLRCLSTTDLLVGLLSQPMYAAYEMSLLNGSLGRCRLTFFISFIAGYILSGVTLFTSTAISLDRLLSLLLGLKYKLVVTLKRARFIVTIIWIVGVVCSALYLWNDQIPLTYAYVCTWICLVISVFFYTTIFVTLRYRQTQVQDLINQHANPTSPMNTAPYRRAVFSALWLQITLVCCYLPHGIMSALLRHSEESAAASFKRHYTITLVFTNSTLTPVYLFFDDQGSSKSSQRNNHKSSEYLVKTQRCTIHKTKARREEGCDGNVCTLTRGAKVCLLATSDQKK